MVHSDVALCQNWDEGWETAGQLQGLKTLNPEITRKKLKNYPPGPDPKFLKKYSKNTKITRKIVFSGDFSIFWVFLRNLGSGPGGNFLVFFE